MRMMKIVSWISEDSEKCVDYRRLGECGTEGVVGNWEVSFVDVPVTGAASAVWTEADTKRLYNSAAVGKSMAKKQKTVTVVKPHKVGSKQKNGGL